MRSSDFGSIVSPIGAGREDLARGGGTKSPKRAVLAMTVSPGAPPEPEVMGALTQALLFRLIQRVVKDPKSAREILATIKRYETGGVIGGGR